MSFYPSHAPLSDMPDPTRYERMLCLAAGIGISSEVPFTWSVEDAAAYWLPGWLPPSGESDALPADGIMGLATRAFLSLCVDLPPLGLLCRALPKLPRMVKQFDGGPYCGVSPHGFCYAAHIAFAPNGQAVGERVGGTGFRAIAEINGTRCDDHTCRESESMLGRCLPQTVFDNACRAGVLLPTRRIDASPLTLLITRLSSWRINLPSIAVRQGADHIKCLYAPYWVHDAIVNLARIIPMLLVDSDRQALIRFSVAKGHEESIAELRKPLPHAILRRDPKTGTYSQVPIDRRACAVEQIWRTSGAAACVCAHLQEPIAMWFGKKNLF